MEIRQRSAELLSVDLWQTWGSGQRSRTKDKSGEVSDWTGTTEVDETR